MLKSYAAYLVLVLSLSSLTFANTAPTVSSVTASQRTDGSGYVDIAYTLNDPDGDKCTISVVVSSDGGSTWTITPSSGALSGALTNVSNGRRQITWNSKLDLPGEFGNNYRVKVTADDNYVPPIPADMVYIPGGTFQMGDSFGGEGYSSELPVHSVTLSPFYIGKYEITNGQYCEFLNSALAQGLITNPTTTSNVVYKAGSGTSYPYCDTYQADTECQINWDGSTFTVRTKSGRSMTNDPMVQVSWYGAVAYCNWRSQQEGRNPCYNILTAECDFSKNGYHLPTEAQWEYAARGGLEYARFPWGDTITHDQANYWSEIFNYDISSTRGYHPTWNDGVSPYTSPVGSFAANGFGLYDMAGNVWEWCNDWYGEIYYSSSPNSNPTGPTTGYSRVLRGGGWGILAYHCRVAGRFDIGTPYYRPYCSGFRISLDYE